MIKSEPDLIPHAPTPVPAPIDLLEAARDYVAASKAPATRKAYQTDWRAFERSCQAQGVCALPAAPETVALYLTALARKGRKPSGIERVLASISQAHKTAGYESPRKAAAVQCVRQGIRRTHGTAPNQKAAVLVSDLRAVVTALPAGPAGVRDAALLLLGFAGAFRRSELCQLNVDDLSFTGDGLVVVIQRSKTDQEGAGTKVAIPYGSDPSTCPVRAVKRWLEESQITSGPLFRSINKAGRLTMRTPGTEGRLDGRDVARIVKQAVSAANLDPAKFSGHSLRAGLATSAARAGKSERSIMRQGRWRSANTARRYIRDAGLFEDCAASGIGL